MRADGRHGAVCVRKPCGRGRVEEGELLIGIELARRQAEVQAQARLDQAATRLERARLNLADADRAIADTEIRAPFAGVLADVNITRESAAVGEGQTGRLLFAPR